MHKIHRNIEEKIMKAALEVINDATIDGLRMHLVAHRAGMGQSTLHYYFKTRQDLLLATLLYLEKNINSLQEEVLFASSVDLKSRLKSFFETRLKVIQEFPQYDHAQVDFWCQSHVDARIKEVYKSNIKKWNSSIAQIILEHSHHLPEQTAHTAARMMVSMMLGATLQYLNGQGRIDLNRYFDACLEFTLHYLDQAESKKAVHA